MVSTVSLGVLCALLLLQDAPPSRFVGTWVGVQRWVADTPSPGAREEQPVELTIEMVDGKLAGFMNPFFGGSDGARFVDVTIAGDQLQASAVMGKQPGARNWKSAVRISFDFRSESDVKLTGTADVFLDNVKWLKFSYDLSKKRSRY